MAFTSLVHLVNACNLFRISARPGELWAIVLKAYPGIGRGNRIPPFPLGGGELQLRDAPFDGNGYECTFI